MRPGNIPAALPELSGYAGPERLCLLQNLRPKQTAESGPVCQRHSRRHPRKPFSHRAGYQHQQNHVRHPHHQISQPGHRRIRRLSQRRQKRQKKSDTGADCGGKQPEQDAVREPRQCSGKHIPPHTVRSKQMAGTGRQIFPHKIRLHRALPQKHPRHHHRRKQQNSRHRKYGTFPLISRIIRKHSSVILSFPVSHDSSLFLSAGPQFHTKDPR